MSAAKDETLFPVPEMVGGRPPFALLRRRVEETQEQVVCALDAVGIKGRDTLLWKACAEVARLLSGVDAAVVGVRSSIASAEARTHGYQYWGSLELRDYVLELRVVLAAFEALASAMDALAVAERMEINALRGRNTVVRDGPSAGRSL